MYASQLDKNAQQEIAKQVEKVLRETSIYSDSEISEYVQTALDSKISDLEELIDVKRYINK